MTKILFQSNAPWEPSGYGTQMALILPRLKELGHEISMIANHGIMGQKAVWNDIDIWHPSDFDPFANDVLDFYVELLKPDLFITLYDIWPLSPSLGFKSGIRWIPWLPNPLEELCLDDKTRLESAYHAFSWSEYGLKLLKDGGFECSLVPLGVDTKNYRPVVNRDDWKKWIGCEPDSFVIGMVAANHDTRKNIHLVIKAFQKFLKDVPEARLYIHAPLNSPGGVNLEYLTAKHEVTKQCRITSASQYHFGFTPAQMCGLYNAFDTIILPSNSEGWGLPLTEGQACGVPAISTNFGSMAETVAPSGILIDPVAIDFFYQVHHTYGAMVTSESILDAMHQMYKSFKSPYWEDMRTQAREFALQWDIDTVVEKNWVPALALLDEKIKNTGKVEAWLN